MVSVCQGCDMPQDVGQHRVRGLGIKNGILQNHKEGTHLVLGIQSTNYVKRNTKISNSTF